MGDHFWGRLPVSGSSYVSLLSNASLVVYCVKLVVYLPTCSFMGFVYPIVVDCLHAVLKTVHTA